MRDPDWSLTFSSVFLTDNIPDTSDSSSEGEVKRQVPVVPPRPSPELILERCTDKTRKRVSIHQTPP